MDIDEATRLLSSTGMTDVLAFALLGPAGERPPGFRTNLESIHPRAGSDVTAIFSVVYDLPSPDEPTTEYLGATTADVSGDVAELTLDDLVLRVWRHPDDPALPGLLGACDPDTVAGWLGVDHLTSLETTAYRPLRRAVIRAEADGLRAFVKVMRPRKADALHKRLRLVARAGVGPALLAAPGNGVLVTAAAEGESLAEALVAWDSDPDRLPTSASLVALLDSLPARAIDLRRRDAWSDRLDFHGANAVGRLPGEAGRIESLVADLTGLRDTSDPGPLTVVHGDFYEANIFVVGGKASGVIDVDSLGPGHRVDDLACLLAHVAVLPDLSPGHYPRVAEVLEGWRGDFEALVDPVALRARTAAVLVSLIGGGTPGQARVRLGLAERWRDLAREAAG